MQMSAFQIPVHGDLETKLPYWSQ